MTGKPGSVSVIIPAKNEADCLPAVLQGLPKDVVSEVVVVDGRSTDGTREVVERLGYRVVSEEGGPGYGAGVKTGLKHVAGDYVTMMDADGSYDPEALSRLRAKLEEGYDVVFCSRYHPESGSDDDTPIRLLGNKLFTLLLRALRGVRISDALFLYVLARREVFDRIEMKSEGFDYCIEFAIRVHQAGLRYTEIPSRERKRIAGDSKVNALVDGLKILAALLKH